MSASTALIRKSICQAVNIGSILRSQSLFKVVFILGFASAFEIGLFMLFSDGFRFLDSLGGAGSIITSRLFALFFLGMGSMLVLSSIVTAYSTIYRSPEIPFLIVHPFSISQIVLYKFIESASLSSWAFGFIIIPFIGAFAWHRGFSLLLLLWTFLFSIPFLLLCCAIGVTVTMLVVRWMPRGRWVRWALFSLAVIGVFAGWVHSRQLYDYTQELQFNMARLIPGLSLASNEFLPSWWMAEGIMLLSRGETGRGLMFFNVLLSSMLVAAVGVEWIGRHTFYEGWQRVAGGTSSGSRSRLLLPRLDAALGFLAPDIRAMVLKDIRFFLRDPMQWSQVLIFFGLLALYYSNLRSFRYDLLPDSWRNTVGFLNVFSVSAVMCSLGARFIYPQLSLEGQGFWIVGLSPTTMRRVLLAKFGLALVGLTTISVSLMLLSCAMLKASLLTRFVAVGLSGSISLAVCGLSTGLGAIFRNLEQRNPAAIVSGFGGTLNLVLSLAFMLAVIIPYGLVFHFFHSGRIPLHALHPDLILCTLWMILLTGLATVIPLGLAARDLKQREF